MPITVAATGTLAENASASTTLNVPYPTISGGILSTDFLVLWTALNNLNPATNPSGWTFHIETAAGAASPTTSLRSRFAAGGETGNLAVTTPSATSRGQMLLLRGVDSTTPLAASPTEIERASGNTNYNIPGQTMPTTGCILVYGAASNTNTGTFSTPTVPAAFTEVTDDPSPTPHGAFGYLIWGSSGATGTIDLTRSTSIRGGAFLVAFQPSAGVTNYNGTATLSATDSLTSAGSVGKVASASVSETAALSSAGLVGKVAAASLAASVAITAAGVVGTSTGASVSETAAVTSAGVVGKFSDATLGSTATITAAGSVAGSGVNGSAALAVTDTITAAGQVGKATGVSLSGTDALTATGQVGKVGAGSLAGSVAVTAAGVVGKSAGATVAETAALTSTGVVGKQSGASLTGSAAVAADGSKGVASSASLGATATITAAGAVVSGISGTAALAATAAITTSGTVGTVTETPVSARSTGRLIEPGIGHLSTPVARGRLLGPDSARFLTAAPEGDLL